MARASVASPTFVPLSCRRFHRYYLRKPDGILLLVDALWFGSLGHGDVFRKTLSIRWAIFAASFAATFFILYGWFLALRRAYQPRFVEQWDHLHRQAAGEVAGRAHPPSYRRYRYATRSRSNRRRHVGGWPTFALYWYAPRATAELSIQSSPGRCTFICSRSPAADYGVATGAGGDSRGIAIFIILTTGSFQVFAGRVHGLQ